VRRPELWVAGVSRATVRRAAKTGVWHPVALAPEELRSLREGFDGRTILRVSAYFADEPRRGEDERGRHAVEGPPEWIAERLREYVTAGCDGFVVNLGHDAPDLEERTRRFGAEVVPLL
jgi:alkanesulfonate monooxygenase SsuD/methylene tetrahydromethanopterin reductase-like flavin-dependent oxidoreductase (luciferase family)